MAAHGTTDRPFNALNTLLKGKLNERREVRVRYRAPFYLLWDEQSSQPKYAKAVCNEVSERGMSMETSQSIAVGTRLSLRSESGALFGGALVKHATKHGSSYVVGMEFGYSLLEEARALVREVYSSPGVK
jgi:hypothetical protein